MNRPTVRCAVDGRGMATVTLDRAEKHNAFDDIMIGEIDRILADLEMNPDVRVVVLEAEGKSFSAGADLNWMQRSVGYTREENVRDAAKLAEMLRKLNYLSHPTIAQVQGATFGGGVGLVSCCDVVVASPHAVFSLSEVKIGLIPSTIAPYVIAAIGQRAARRFFTAAERIDAETAQRLGLVSVVVPEDSLTDEVNRFVGMFLGNGPRAVRGAKRLVFDFADRPLTPELIDDTSERIADARASEEGQEGLKAFLEKRTPNWATE